MRRAKCINAPALSLAARDQAPDADDLVQGMFGETRAKRAPDISLRFFDHIEHSRRRGEIGYRL